MWFTRGSSTVISSLSSRSSPGSSFIECFGTGSPLLAAPASSSSSVTSSTSNASAERGFAAGGAFLGAFLVSSGS